MVHKVKRLQRKLEASLEEINKICDHYESKGDADARWGIACENKALIELLISDLNELFTSNPFPEYAEDNEVAPK